MSKDAASIELPREYTALRGLCDEMLTAVAGRNLDRVKSLKVSFHRAHLRHEQLIHNLSGTRSAALARRMSDLAYASVLLQGEIARLLLRQRYDTNPQWFERIESSGMTLSAYLRQLIKQDTQRALRPDEAMEDKSHD